MAASGPAGSPRPGGEPILKDVVAYVEVWSSSGVENYSKTFVNQLLGMGAKVSKTFNRNVTHVIFKEGYQSTWDKAQKYGVKLVSVLWVERCRLAGVRVDESLFPAINTKEGLPCLIKKKRKCMQPKDFVPRTPENDRRLQKKIEKMANELHIQKTAIDDDDIPVLLFEADGSLIYSPTAKIKDQCNAMEKRLQEMKDKRENLSPTFSQMLALNSDPSSSGTCLNTSLNTSHSDESISDVLNTSFDDIWRNRERRKRKIKSKKHIHKAKTDACLSSPMSKTASNSLSERVNPQRSKISNLPTETRNVQNTLMTEMLTPEKTQFERISKEIFSEKGYLSPSSAVAQNHSVRSPGPTNSSEKQLRSLIRLNFSSKEKSRKKKSKMRFSSPKLHLSKTKNFLELMTSPVKISPACKEAVYDDYFSPTNLKEGNSRNCTFEVKQLLESPSHLNHQKSIYRSKKQSILENTDYRSFSKKKKLILASDNLVEENCRLKKLPSCERNVNLNCSPYSEIPDAKETLGYCNETDSQERKKNITIGGNNSLHTTDESVLINDCLGREPCDALTTLEGGAKEVLINNKELTIPMTIQKRENINSEMLNSCENEKQEDINFIFKSDAALEKSVKEMENPSRCIQSVESRKVKLDILDDVSEGFRDQKIKSLEESKKTTRVKKPTRTLVMTSMPSEKQNIIMQVVDKLKDFSFSCDVCETTTHVVAGEPRRTLSVLLGIARGCWIVSYEWNALKIKTGLHATCLVMATMVREVLWSLEFGFWVSEEPYELSDKFPAASICRLERHLSAGRYRGDLFASQPRMFITAACEPPCAKLRELVQLCGGQVSRSPFPASICIGPYRGKKHPEIKYLSEKWILDSITQHKICPCENYLMA